MHRQGGISIVFVVIVVIAVGAVFLALMGLFRSTTGIEGSVRTQANLAAAGEALEQFASTAARLPCPADPSLDTGDAVPAGAAATCTFPAGTLPWRTIGLRREDAIDAWGGKISYRVFTGTAGIAGSLTQAEGTSMVKCDTLELAPTFATPVAGTAGGLCRDTNDTPPAQFLLNKGLSVSDSGTTATGVAYVLVSHGPTGLGGFTTAGAQRPLPGNAGEIANTTAAGPFVAQPSMTTGLAPNDPAYFDDVIAYRKLDEFVQRAKLGARDWPDAPPHLSDVTTTFNQATVGVAAGVSSVDDIGNFFVFTGDTISIGADGAALQDLSFETVNATTGIGVAGGSVMGDPLEPNNNLRFISSVGSESVSIIFGQKQQWFAVTLNHFGIYSPIGSPLVYTEKVDITFFNDGVQVDKVTKSGCRADGQLASFSVHAAGIFNAVLVNPVAATEPGGTTNQSAFLLSQFGGCLDAAPSCFTPLAVANPDSACP